MNLTTCGGKACLPVCHSFGLVASLRVNETMQVSEGFPRQSALPAASHTHALLWIPPTYPYKQTERHAAQVSAPRGQPVSQPFIIVIMTHRRRQVGTLRWWDVRPFVLSVVWTPDSMYVHPTTSANTGAIHRPLPHRSHSRISVVLRRWIQQSRPGLRKVGLSTSTASVLTNQPLAVCTCAKKTPNATNERTHCGDCCSRANFLPAQGVFGHAYTGSQ